MHNNLFSMIPNQQRQKLLPIAMWSLDARTRKKPVLANSTKKQPVAWSSGQQLCCAVCRAPITKSEYATEVENQHVHQKSNPQGTNFVIACFCLAEGCYSSGTMTGEYSWFAGHKWCFASCRSCASQLGWYFTGSGTESFYALIMEQLTDCNLPL